MAVSVSAAADHRQDGDATMENDGVQGQAGEFVCG